MLRRTFPSAGRLVARRERAGAPARLDRPLARAWPTLHRERRQRRAATRSRSARGLHDLGRRARHRLDPACRLRREDSGLEDSPRRVAPLSRRSAGVGLLSLPPWLPRATLLAGAALAVALAFPPTDWEALVWVALVPVFVTAVSCPPRVAFGWGWLYGAIHFLVLLHWLDFTFRTYSDIPWPLTWGPTLALAGYCGLYVGAVAGAISWLARPSIGWALAVSPFLWVGGEWIRGHLFGGFPWGLIGYSQYLSLPVIQIAELAGVYAISLVIVAVNAALAGCFVLSRRSSVQGVALAAALLVGTLGFGAWRLSAPAPTSETRVAIMQPSIEQPLKFVPDHAATTVAIYLNLTRRAGAEHPQLIVWPETALPAPLRRDRRMAETLEALSASIGSPLL